MNSTSDKVITISIFALMGAFVLPALGSIAESKATPLPTRVGVTTGSAVIEEPKAQTSKKQRPILCLEWIEARAKDGSQFAVCTDDGKHVIATRYRVFEMLANEADSPGRRTVKALAGWK